MGVLSCPAKAYHLSAVARVQAQLFCARTGRRMTMDGDELGISAMRTRGWPA